MEVVQDNNNWLIKRIRPVQQMLDWRKNLFFLRANKEQLCVRQITIQSQGNIFCSGQNSCMTK